jgi:hypothetical protein
MGLMRLETEADHLPPYSIEVNNGWKYSSALPDAFISGGLNKFMDNFIVITLFVLNWKDFE